jgi:hypothetical protein
MAVGSGLQAADSHATSKARQQRNTRWRSSDLVDGPGEFVGCGDGEEAEGGVAQGPGEAGAGRE